MTPANPGLEPLEQRLLLSGVGQGDTLSFNNQIESDGNHYLVALPTEVRETTSPSASGEVFHDIDRDGFWDPHEHALEGVTVFTDLDGDGVLSGSEPSATTTRYGSFWLSSLPAGEHVLRVIPQQGYGAGLEASTTATVTITDSTGVRDLQIGLWRTGLELGVELVNRSIPSSYKTGTDVKIPVILTNHGDTALRPNQVRLRVWLSESRDVNDDSKRLFVKAINKNLLPGRSLKLNLKFRLPDALADFRSYLIVDTVGHGLRTDYDRTNNQAVSLASISFAASTAPRTIGLSDLNIVLGNWNSQVPYGGYEPGEGYVGIEDLNTILGNWNTGTPPTTTISDQGWTWQDFRDERWAPWLDPTHPGLPGSISGRIYDVHAYDGDDPTDHSGSGLAGWTVYLDQNLNGHRDSHEQSTVTTADGSYTFTDLPTNDEVEVFPMLYYVEAEAPEGWKRDGLGYAPEFWLGSGVDHVGHDIGYYQAPTIGRVQVHGGALANGIKTRITAHDVNAPDTDIKQVVFYYDHDGDGRVEDILGVDTDGSDGYSIVTNGLEDWRSGWLLNNTGKVYAVVQDVDGHTGLAETKTQFQNAIEVRAGKKLVYKEADGKRVTVELKGRGSARVVLFNPNVYSVPGMSWYDFGRKVEVSGVTLISQMTVSGTNGRSRLMITATGGTGSGSVNIPLGLSGTSPLGKLYAPDVVFGNAISMYGRGTIGQIVAGSLNGLSMSGQRFASGVTIQADYIKGQLDINSHVKLLEAGTARWMFLTAPSADRIAIKTDYMLGRVVLTDPDVGVNLRILSVGRKMNSVTVRAERSIDTVYAKRMIHSSIGAGAWTPHYVVGDLVPQHGIVRRGSIQNLTAEVFEESYISAWRLGTVDLGSAERRAADDRNYGLAYHHLGVYRGPDNIEQTVI